jgi:catechol 2,3-dioxygenase-like lactoylglutathione lyase family enzyme
MLTNAPIVPTIPVVDVKRARKFYEEKLSLKPWKEMPDGVIYECGEGTKIALYQRGPTKADQTVASFLVKDIEAEVEDLKEKTVTFEEYDIPDIKTVEGIATLGLYKVAWFKDTEGNILSITQLG